MTGDEQDAADIREMAELTRQAGTLLAHRPTDRAEVAAKVALARTLRDLAAHAEAMLATDDAIRARRLLASVDEP